MRIRNKHKGENMIFSVNTTKCLHCGLCVSGCVCGLLKLSVEGVPYVESSRQTSCVHCGHCVAVCPEGAITLDGIASNMLEAAASPLSEALLAQILKARRAIRNFQASDIDDALLKKAFSLAAYAPTAHNARQVAYIVINGRSKVEKLLQATVRLMEEHNIYPGHTRNVRSGHDTLFRGAPCLILIHAPERILSETDCATAASYLELALPSLYLGSCWAGMLIESCAYGLPEGLCLPAGHKLYGALMVGKPDVAYRRIPFRSEPKVTWR